MILVIFILCMIILLIFILNERRCENFSTVEEKPYLWVYWENKNGKETPPIIEICLEIMINRLSNNFRIVKLDQNNINEYIPEIKERKHILDKLIIAHRVDYYRVLLLNKYGGLYLDADIIMLNDLGDIKDKLREYDYIGFGCTGYRCTNGYGMPSNWAMGSKANGIMITRLKNHLENLLDNITEEKIDYHTFGKLAIWEVLEQLIKNENYKYFHYDSEKIGTRDIDGRWITNDMLVSNTRIKFMNEDNLFFIVFYNSDAEKILDNYFRNKTKEDLLNDNTNISYFIKKGYNK